MIDLAFLALIVFVGVPFILLGLLGLAALAADDDKTIAITFH